IEQSKSNIDQLVNSNLMRDVGAQLVNISTALKALQTLAPNNPKENQVSRLAETLSTGEIELLGASREPTDPKAKFRRPWANWCKALTELESFYPPETVKADVFICPMHPLDRHLKSDDKCSVCGMSLVRRHLPASAVYQPPGVSTLRLTVKPPPLVVGQQ